MMKAPLDFFSVVLSFIIRPQELSNTGCGLYLDGWGPKTLPSGECIEKEMII
jgi:hypothetical protein